MVVDINDFGREVQCNYDGERYSVRDNGAVFRHQRKGKRLRPYDNQWVFGKENTTNPYLHIANIRVHRIVATAFHGEPSDPKYVVDHVDTNCRNNRPDNLRWLSRLENALKNPTTRKKIEYLCGSIEAFLENPSILNELQSNPEFKWMRAVTPEEAKNCMARMSYWANSDSKIRNTKVAVGGPSIFGERAYKPFQKWEVGLGREPGLDMALTPWCAQYMWNTDAYFPCCPQELGTNRLEDYCENLKSGNVLSYTNNDDVRFKLTVVKAVILTGRPLILVMSTSADSKWLIVGIELDKKSKHFIHFVLGAFRNKGEAETAFLAKQNLTEFWSEGYSGAYGLYKIK